MIIYHKINHMRRQYQKNNNITEKTMKKINLSGSIENDMSVDGYRLDPTEKYVINLLEEIEFQQATMMSF